MDLSQNLQFSLIFDQSKVSYVCYGSSKYRFKAHNLPLNRVCLRSKSFERKKKPRKTLLINKNYTKDRGNSQKTALRKIFRKVLSKILRACEESLNVKNGTEENNLSKEYHTTLIHRK